MANNQSAIGTLSFEDIYGVGSIDTLGEDTSTQGKTKPAEGGGVETGTKEKASIFSIKGNLFGQPIMVWAGMIFLLVLLKYVVETPAIKKGLGG